MFGIPLMYTFFILVGGPLVNEGLGAKIETDGVKATVEYVWETKEALDYSKLND